MKPVVVVSFEDQSIRVIYASKKKGVMKATDVITLNEAQFADFLRSEKTREFIVVSNFRENFQDTISVPVVKKKYLEKIIEIEIRKRCQFKDFSYIYSLSGEKIIENRKTLEVFVFAVRNDEVMNLISRFTEMGKRVKAIYPDVFSLARMAGTDGKYGLCVSVSGQGKKLFLSRDGRIGLIREANSPESDMTDYDMRNIEMTVNYCRQTLRINPSFIILTGNLSSNYKVSVNTPVPVICLPPPQGIHMDSRVILEYMTAISALYADKCIDIAPRSYKSINFTMELLRYSAAAFLCLTVLSIVYTIIVVKSTLPIREKFQNSIRDLPDIDMVLSSYEREVSRLNEYGPLMSSLERSMDTPDILNLLNSFTRLKGDSIRIDSLDVTLNDGVLQCKIEGSAITENYAVAGRSYEKFMRSLGDIRGLTVTKNVFELKEKKLFVEADYR